MDKTGTLSGGGVVSFFANMVRNFFKRGDRAADIKIIEEEGLRWWFEMDAERIYNNCGWIASSLPPESLPPRALFLSEWLQPVLPAERLEHLYAVFIEACDYEAASASAVAGVNAISVFNAKPEVANVWYNRVIDLLERRGAELSGLARASLLGAKGLAEQNRGDTPSALGTYREMRRVAEKAGSTSVLVYSAGDITYPLVLTGRLSELDIILMDTEPMADMPGTSSMSRAWFMISLGFARLVGGKAREGYKILRKIVKHPLFRYLPLDMRLFAMNHFVLACAFTGAIKEMESFTARILAMAVPEKDFFDHSYTHFCVGVARLATGKPSLAIRHAGQAMKIGRKSHSPVMEALGALLLGQGLSDMGKQRKAVAVFNKWDDRWRERGFHILTASALLERARIFIRQGEMDRARECYDEATDILPDGEAPSPLYRPISFLKELQRQLAGSEGKTACWADPEEAYVRIETFGGLRVWIDGKLVSKKEWGGRKTKNLLKAIIVHGGRNVSAEKIADLLWPEADGDSAMHSLDVTLWRLRKLGGKRRADSVSWIKLRGGNLSLESPLCYVDCLKFIELIESHKDSDGDGLRETLNVSANNFLPEDIGEPWIERYRDFLNEKSAEVTELATKGYDIVAHG